MDELINVRGLVTHYDDFTLKDVSLNVEAGTIVGIIGSNGAGKTTLLKAILGLITPDEGEIRLLGKDPFAIDDAIDAIKQRVGVVLDTCAFPVTAKIKDVDSLGRAAYPRWDAAMFSKLCDRFGLGMKKLVKDLSRGMGMKLTLAFALSHDPDLLILDEATAGLDPMARDEILDMIRDFMKDEDHAVLIASHITTDLEKIADEVVCIDNGKTLFSMPKEEICDTAGIAHCRRSDIEKVIASGFCKESLEGSPAGYSAVGFKMMQRGMGTDLLVPDRFKFASAFPDLEVERISIEDYMTLVLKGESL